MAFDIPRDVILPIERVDVRLAPGPHPFELAHTDAINENWRYEQTANPALYDGQMVLLSSLSHHGARLEGTSHAIRFATFLYWRKHRTYSSAEHVYAHAALVTLTRQDLGKAGRGWLAWWSKAQHRPRVEWLFEALSGIASPSTAG